MGFPARFCGWIETCVTTPRYSIALNGSLVGYFRGVRGVRQGGPLSPYLFVIVMNVLSRLLDVAAKNVLGVKSILEKFYHLSGLKLNALKTELFVCGINICELEQIQVVTGFRSCSLHVRYLGVPLVTRKLSKKDCTALLEKIKDKLRMWSSRKLSFGGRLQLIKVVLFSIFNYWSRQLVLPKGVIQDIERLCMRYFGRVMTPLLEVQGNILAGEGSLWVARIKAYCFKLDDYWNVENKSHFSWILRKMINLQEEAIGLFSTSGNWSQIRGSWIWNNIRDRKSKVAWHKVVWFSAHIPKFSLIAWMVILDRLPTKDRLCRFAMVTDSSCGLCGADLESRNHLFMDCLFSRGFGTLYCSFVGCKFSGLAGIICLTGWSGM
ncbi:uncharacterized protein LOC120168183 [Hibiscus syriacus]|uniref:uncharacterized protein LOC120168183 n=1 Tax=Hibiscus syriacus TaxID=106335 RepID=UPI0019221A60|nr:uncharacterized protein LOC120168183 [Hibiscus syriacus]